MKTIPWALSVLFAVVLPAQADDVDPEVYKARRIALMETLDGGVAVLHGGTGGGGAFIQDSDFFYLTGISEPGAVLLLDPAAHRYKEVLFLQPRNPEVEDWDGRRPPLGDALEEEKGFDQIVRTTILPSYLKAGLARSKKAVFLGPTVGANSPVPESLQLLRDAMARVPGSTLVDGADLIAEMRLIKEPREIEAIQKAIDITGAGIVAAMQAVEAGMREFQLQSVVEHTYKMEGSQFLGFETITAWGPNSTVLHYVSNDEVIKDEGLVLVDTGAAWNHYTADVSRTFPVTGKFNVRERELYELVLKAADAAIDKVRIGNDYYNDVHMTAKGVLEDAGYAQYFIHGTGHFLGLDVHDVGNYDKPLQAGVVITVEPGIYIPEEGIGIRIEDDVLVTKDGPVLLSRRIPRTIDEIEAVMAE